MLIVGTYWFNRGGYTAHLLDAIESGFIEIDTASHYDILDSVGRAIEGKSVLVNSKLWSTEYPFVYSKVEQQYRIFKGKLNTMFIHWPRRTQSDFEVFKNLFYLKREGWIKKVGLCNVTKEMLIDFKKNTGQLPDVVQNESHIGHIDEKTLCYCKDLDIEYQGWGSMYGINHPSLNYYTVEEKAEMSLLYLLSRGIVPVVFSTNLQHLRMNSNTAKKFETLSFTERWRLLVFKRFDADKFGFTGRYPEHYISSGIKRKPILEFGGK